MWIVLWFAYSWVWNSRSKDAKSSSSVTCSSAAIVGSGSLFARGSLKKLYREDLTQEQCVQAVIEALYDAADDDSATGGPDVTRRIFPVVQVITADGGRRIPDSEVAVTADRVIAGRMRRPDGPAAELETRT